jgi:ATP-dependent Clp protease ATP-binding subunit ClpB
MAVRTLDPKRQSYKAEALASRLSLRIVGQTGPTQALLSAIAKYQSGFYDKTKPIFSMLGLGPTGVGKTGVFEAFAEGLFGSPKHMLKVDCAEFQHSHEIAKLVGSPPGYLGHRETHPFFTNASLAALRTPELDFTIVLWDEIEKASDSLWNLLLGILDKGTLTTGTNEKVDMTKTVHLMTSNVGSADISDEASIGFDAGQKQMTDQQVSDTVMAAARRKFMPEFLGRLDEIAVFKTLTESEIAEVLGLQLNDLSDRIMLSAPVPFEFNVSPAAIRQLLKEGYDRRYNARGLKHVIEKHIALPLGRLMSTGQVMPNDIIIVDFDQNWKYYAQIPLARAAAEGDIL